MPTPVEYSKAQFIDLVQKNSLNYEEIEWTMTSGYTEVEWTYISTDTEKFIENGFWDTLPPDFSAINTSLTCLGDVIAGLAFDDFRNDALNAYMRLEGIANQAPQNIAAEGVMPPSEYPSASEAEAEPTDAPDVFIFNEPHDVMESDVAGMVENALADVYFAEGKGDKTEAADLQPTEIPGAETDPYLVVEEFMDF